MNADADGWFTLRRTASHGTRYNFVLEDGCEVPDPASRFQPDDVHGQSEVIDDLSYKWQQKGWLGRPWQEMVIYELHIGTFTSEGTFLSATQRLEHLAYLGVTAIQLMPVNDFRGRRGWGYDGVLLYAPEASYGRPEDMKALIDAAHARGICVFVDVVYNHFGPDGNYLPAYTPLFTAKHKSPWGDGVNYDDNGSENIRRLVIENVLYWIEHFRVDGLRFDAVHAIIEQGLQGVRGVAADEVAEPHRSGGDKVDHRVVSDRQCRNRVAKQVEGPNAELHDEIVLGATRAVDRPRRRSGLCSHPANREGFGSLGLQDSLCGVEESLERCIVVQPGASHG